MPYTTSGKNVMLDYLRSVTTHASAHSGTPGDSGTSEASGGSPAYARKPVTFSAASGGVINATNQPVMDVPAMTVSHVGFWSASSAGSIYAYATLGTPQTFGSQGTFTLLSVAMDLNA